MGLDYVITLLRGAGRSSWLLRGLHPSSESLHLPGVYPRLGSALAYPHGRSVHRIHPVHL